VKSDRCEFQRRSRERLAGRRDELVKAFRRELESKTGRAKAVKRLLAEEEEDSHQLTRSLAAHGELGAELRRLAEEIASIDGRIAEIDAELRPERAEPG
jgi:chromosome segregation ATPase